MRMADSHESKQGENARPPLHAPASYLDALDHGNGGAGPKSSAQYLGTALGVGFRLVRVLMLLLGMLFLFSNVYWVPEGTVAIHTRFGRIVGGRRPVVKGPGGPHWALPHPIERVTRIPSTVQHLSMQRPFRGDELGRELSARQRRETTSLVPGRDGSLVTGDKNIVQGTWDVRFRLDYTPGEPALGVVDFARNVGSIALASNLVQRETEAAIVRIVARTSVDDFVAGRIDNAQVQKEVSARLAALKTGLRVIAVSAGSYAPPAVLAKEFEAVTLAESEKALQIEKATRHRVSTMGELVGRDWRHVLNAVNAYDAATRSDDPERRRATFAAAKRTLSSLGTGGHVAQVLDRARGEKTRTIQAARSAASRFGELLPAYRSEPSVLKNQLTQDTIQRIWSSPSVGAWYVPANQKLYLDLGDEDVRLE